jgi:hypothetical protein
VLWENAGDVIVLEDSFCADRPKPDGCARCVGARANGGTGDVIKAWWEAVECQTDACNCGVFPLEHTIVSCVADGGESGTAELTQRCVLMDAGGCSWLPGPCTAISHQEPGSDGQVCVCQAPEVIATCDNGEPATVTDDCLQIQTDAGVRCKFRQVCELPVGVDCDCPRLDTLSLDQREVLTCYDNTVLQPECVRRLDGSTAVCEWHRGTCPEPPESDACAAVSCAEGTQCVGGHCVPSDWSVVFTFNTAIDDVTRAELEQAIASNLAQHLNRDATDFDVTCASNAETGTTSCIVAASQHDGAGNADPVEPRDSNQSEEESVNAAGQASASAAGPNAALLTATPNSQGSSAATALLSVAVLLLAAVALLF